MTPGRIPEDTWDAAVAALTRSRCALLVGHCAPDGDALGSALAVAIALRSLGSDRHVVVSVGDDPFALPANLAHLPGLEMVVPPAQAPAEPDVVVTFDASSIDRLGVLAERAQASPAMVVLDHHASYTGFGDIRLHDVTAPATAVIAEELVRRLRVPLSADIAANIYTGLVTDTGSFRYAGTTPQALELGARLIATGIPFDEIARDLFDTTPFSYLGVLGRALDRAVLEAGAVGGLGLVWTVVPMLDRRQTGLPLDQVEGVVDVVRKAGEAEVACVVKEDDTGRLRVSMRSKGRVDVSRAATELGGGGHRYAAGYTADTRDLDVLLADLRSALAALPHEGH